MSKFKRNSNVVVNIKRHDVNVISEKEVKYEPRESRILMIKTRDGKVLVDRTNKKKKDKSNNMTKTDSKVVKQDEMNKKVKENKVHVVVNPKGNTVVDLTNGKKEDVDLPNEDEIYNKSEYVESDITVKYVDTTPFEGNDNELEIIKCDKGPEREFPEPPKRKRKHNDKYVSVKDLKEKKNEGGDITKLPKEVQDIITNPEPEEIPFPVPPGVNTNVDLDYYNSYMDSIEDDEYSKYDNEPTFEKMKSNKKGGIE